MQLISNTFLSIRTLKTHVIARISTWLNRGDFTEGAPFAGTIRVNNAVITVHFKNSNTSTNINDKGNSHYYFPVYFR